MNIKINGVELPEYPEQFSVTVLDIDDGDTTVRTADGTLNRDRIAVKRRIQMAWGLIGWQNLSTILQSMQSTFFEVYYPDPMTGTYATKTFYASDRPALVAYSSGGDVRWSGLDITLIEK
jgi:hypothetical protein